MSIQYAGGTYVDQSAALGANAVQDYMALLTTHLPTAGWTITALNSWNIYGNVPNFFNQSNPTNNQTVTINGRVYTYKTTLTGAVDEILIGASMYDTLYNTRACWNLLSGAGTLYGTGTTINADITVVAIGYLASNTTAPSLIVASKSASTVTVSEANNFAWYNTSATSQALYKAVSATTPAFQKITLYYGADCANVANQFLTCVENGDASLINGRIINTNTITGDTVRLLAHRYGFHTFEVGAFSTNGTGFFCQVPYIPSFLAPKSVTGATNASPIEITTSAAHGYQTGDSVLLKYIQGNTAANGVFSITVTGATTFTLNSSVGNGTFSGTQGRCANQTPPRIEVLEQIWLSAQATTSACYLNSSSNYATGNSGLQGWFDGTPYTTSTSTQNMTLPKAVNMANTAYDWVSGASLALEPLMIFTVLYAGVARCAGQLYNAWWAQTSTPGGATNTADGHTWYGIYNNDVSGQLFLLTS